MEKRSTYENLTLAQLADKLDTEFYQPAIEKCEQTVTQLVITDSKEALMSISNIIGVRQQSLLSYLQTLAEKSSTGHDCSNCPGRCDMGHAQHLMDIKESHIAINGHISGIDMNELADELQQLTNLVTELVRIEEQVLVPKIWDAQRKINVVS